MGLGGLLAELDFLSCMWCAGSLIRGLEEKLQHLRPLPAPQAPPSTSGPAHHLRLRPAPPAPPSTSRPSQHLCLQSSLRTPVHTEAGNMVFLWHLQCSLLRHCVSETAGFPTVLSQPSPRAFPLPTAGHTQSTQQQETPGSCSLEEL